jgi:hypothetical protein
MPEPIIATLIPRKSGGKNYYTYSVEFAGELIVEGSTNPEHDACRALLAKGFTGTLLLQDCSSGKGRTRIDIERGASWAVSEDQKGFRLRKWSPWQGDSLAAEANEPSADTPEAA